MDCCNVRRCEKIYLNLEIGKKIYIIKKFLNQNNKNVAKGETALLERLSINDVHRQYLLNYIYKKQKSQCTFKSTFA